MVAQLVTARAPASSHPILFTLPLPQCCHCDNRMLPSTYGTDYHMSLSLSCFADQLPVTHCRLEKNRKTVRVCYPSLERRMWCRSQTPHSSLPQHAFNFFTNLVLSLEAKLTSQ
ncbi:hypothetical protein BDR06DRAFT_952467 [Suillus hirtellus]|nr:hypothetical protein BDR06DRAFT_952467 [Suillus hirtellus]